MKMHELLSTEKRWTQHASARDEFGDVTSSMSRNAVSFCLLGALDRCYAQAQFSKRAAALNALVSKCGGRRADVFKWNDTHGRTFGEVRALLKELNL
jgi:hypothetical protein